MNVELVPWLGVIAASGATAVALLTRDPRLRAAAMLVALALAPVLVAADVWDTERFADLRDTPVRLAALAGAGAGAVGLLTAAILRWPAAFALLAFGVLVFRIPVRLGGETSNLLLPLYLVIAAGACAFAIRRFGELRSGALSSGGSPQRHPAGSPARRAVDVATAAVPWLLAAFVVVYALQSAYSSDLSKATETLSFFLVPFAVMFALLREVRWTPRLLGVLLVLVVAQGVAFVAVGVWQYGARELFWNPTVIAANEVHTYFRVNSVFWDPNVFGRYLILAVIAAASFMVWTRRAGMAVAAAVACLVLLVGLTLSYSQSSAVALLAGLVALIAPRWGVRWAVGTGAVAAVAAIALALASGVEPTSSRSLEIRSSGRVTLVRGGLELAGDRPVLGYGAGSFQNEFAQRHLAVDDPPGAAISHSEPVTVAAEQGAVGLLLYAALVLTGLVALFGSATGLPAARTALVACFVAMIVHSLAYAGFLIDPVTWALLGLGVALAGAPLASRATRPAAARERRRPAPSPPSPLASPGTSAEPTGG